MKAHFHIRFYESLQADFREFRNPRRREEQDAAELAAVRHHMEGARRTVITIAHSDREKTVLLYCIDTLLALWESGDSQKTAAFAAAIDMVPSAFAGKNDLRRCHSAVSAFREEYGKEYFPDWEMHYPYFETDNRMATRRIARSILNFSIYILPILLIIGIMLLDYTPIPLLVVLLLLVPIPVLTIALVNRAGENERVFYYRKGLFREIWNEHEKNRFSGAFRRKDSENYTDEAVDNTIEIHFDLHGRDFFIDIDESGIFLLVDEESSDPVEERFSYGDFSTLDDLFAAINEKVDEYAKVNAL